MNAKKTALLVAMGLMLAGAAGASAYADTPWQAAHPRREQVNSRLHNQNLRIQKERREGELNGRQARRLHAEDRGIRRQERRFARQDGGHISRAEQHRLNREENKVSGQIGR
jgi:Flp pilus assembly protein TadB